MNRDAIECIFQVDGANITTLRDKSSASSMDSSLHCLNFRNSLNVFHSLGSLVVFTITTLLRSLEISASIISVSTGEKFKGGTN